MSDVVDPRDTEKFAAHTFASGAAGEILAGLRATANPRGYRVDSNTHIVAGDLRVNAQPPSAEPESWFSVYPLDQPDETKTFATADEVRAYLEALAPDDGGMEK